MATGGYFRNRLIMFYYHARKFPKYGLYFDDIRYNDREGVLKESVRRLPPEVASARQFRITRARILSSSKEYLPREQWTPLDADHLYLTEIYDQVKKEFELKKDLKKKV